MDYFLIGSDSSSYVQSTLTSTVVETVTSFSPLQSIFDNNHAEKVPRPVRPRMKCLWCGTVFSEAHATRMIIKLVQQLNKNVKP